MNGDDNSQVQQSSQFKRVSQVQYNHRKSQFYQAKKVGAAPGVIFPVRKEDDDENIHIEDSDDFDEEEEE